jgi:curved DNA-binding protein
VRIPAGTQNGQQLRIRGQGLPIGKSGGKGDLFVVSNLQVPTDVSDEEKKLWEKFRVDSSFRPRADARS